MGHALRAVASLLVGVAILMLGNGLLNIVLPIRLTQAALPTEITGLVMAAQFGGLVVGSIYCKAIIARVGHIRAFAAFAAITAAAALAYALLFSPVTWGLLRFVSGFCMAGLFAAIESWINERSSNEMRGQVLSLYMITNYFSLTLSQFLINLWDIGATELFILPSILISLSLVPVVLTRVSAPEIGRIAPLGFRALYAVSPLAVIASFCSGITQGSIHGMGAVFAQAIGLSVFEVSLFMGSAIFGGLVLQWPVGRLSDRFDRRSVLAWVLVVLTVASAAMVALTVLEAARPLAALLLIVAVLAGLSSCIYPIAVAQVFDFIDRERMVAASSGLVLAYAVGATGGPFAASVLMSHGGPQGLFLFIGVVAVLLAAFLVYRMRRRAGLPAGAQAAFVPVTPTTAVGGRLDPRTEPQPEPLEPGAGDADS